MNEKVEFPIKLTERKEIIERGEYKEIQYHKYKGVPFFTAIYNEHVVLEPVHQEILDAINAVSGNYIEGPLWHDSAHTWSRGLTLQGQRNRLIEYAHEDIDYLMSGQGLKEQRTEYLKKRKTLKEQWEFFKKIKGMSDSE